MPTHELNASYPYDPDLHSPGSGAAGGRCSYHQDRNGSDCAGEAVVSFQDGDGQWQSGCSQALEQLVDAGKIQPLGQGG